MQFTIQEIVFQHNLALHSQEIIENIIPQNINTRKILTGTKSTRVKDIVLRIIYETSCLLFAVNFLFLWKPIMKTCVR